MIYNLRACNRILLPRFDTFGDLVIFSSFLQSLRSFVPEAELCLLVRRGYDELANLFPVSLRLRWVVVDQQAYECPGEESRAEFHCDLIKLKAGQWDVVLMTAFNHTWLDYQLIDELKGVRKVILGSFTDALGIVKSECDVVAVEERLHETEKYRLLLERLSGEQAGEVIPRLQVPAVIAIGAEDELLRLHLNSSCFVVCLPAGTQNQKHKAWPLENYAEVLSWLAIEKKLEPLLVGHVSEAEPVNLLASMLADRNVMTVTWLGSSGDIPRLAALLRRASLFIGTDSGPMHIAAALDVPTVGIFGGGHFFRFLPVGAKAVGVAVEIPCYGCHWECIFDDAPCIRLVEVSHVKEAIEAVLGPAQLNTNLLNFSTSVPRAFFEIIENAKAIYTRFLKELSEQSQSKQMALQDLYTEIERERALVRGLKMSLSWRVTAPLRRICDEVRTCLK